MAYQLLGRLVPAVLLAATATLGGSAFVDPAIACAAPPAEWDVKGYDHCIRDVILNPDPNKSFTAEHKRCCTESGGQWNESTRDCVAPPAQPAGSQPGVAPSPGVATQTLEPAPPPIRNPGVVTETFTPAPVG